MVLGLGGTSLPPRPCRAGSRHGGSAGAEAAAPCNPSQCLARVHSSTGLAEGAEGATSQQHLVGAQLGDVATPCGEPPPPQQPTVSDQSTAAPLGGQDSAVAGSRGRQQQQVCKEPDGGSGGADRDGAASAGARDNEQGNATQPDGSRQHQQLQQVAQQPHGRLERNRTRSRSRLAPANASPGGARVKGSRGRSSSPAAAAAAAAAKRQKTAAAGGSQVHHRAGGQRPSKYSDILHRCVVVPGSIFFVDEPGQVYIGRVNKAESGRRVPSVEVQFFDDASKYWFPVSDVQRWMAGMVRDGTWDQHNPGVPAPDFDGLLAAAHGEAGATPGAAPGEDEEGAAKALQSLSASLASRPVPSGGGVRGVQPAVSSGRQRRRSDAASRGQAGTGAESAPSGGGKRQRHGGSGGLARLDIIASAADMHGASSPPGVS